MLNKSEDTNIYTNKPDKSVRLGRFIGPIFLYYVLSIFAQLLWGLWALPKILVDFIKENEQVIEMMPEGYESLALWDLLYVFINGVDEDGYFEFFDALIFSALNNVGVITVLSAILAIPCFLFLMKRDRVKNRVYMFHSDLKWKAPRYGWIILGSVVLCIALNSLITLSNLEQLSASYEETAEALYAISLPLQVVGLGIFVPIFEELLYRGIFYNRLKVNLPKYSAIGVSAFIFGTMHGNLVQMLYAFILGVVFAWLYEVYKSIWAPILAHMFMNLTSVALSNTDMFEWVFNEPMRVGIVTVACATASAAVYVTITNIISADKSAE